MYLTDDKAWKVETLAYIVVLFTVNKGDVHQGGILRNYSSKEVFRAIFL